MEFVKELRKPKPKVETLQVMVFENEKTGEERRLEIPLPMVGMELFTQVKKAFKGQEAKDWIMKKAWTE